MSSKTKKIPIQKIEGRSNSGTRKREESQRWPRLQRVQKRLRVLRLKKFQSGKSKASQTLEHKTGKELKDDPAFEEFENDYQFDDDHAFNEFFRQDFISDKI